MKFITRSVGNSSLIHYISSEADLAATAAKIAYPEMGVQPRCRQC